MSTTTDATEQHGQTPHSQTLHYRSFTTPVGALTVVADVGANPAVVAAGFCPVTDLLDRMKLDHDSAKQVETLDPFDDDIVAYINGDVSALERVPTRQPGTVLQQQVWTGLRAIPAGKTATYTELAASTDKPRAVRAAGTACGRNLIAPFVPCHRALRSDGSLGGYYYGLPVKRWLLDLEGVTSAA